MMDNYKRAFVLMADHSQFIQAFFVLTPIMFAVTSCPGTGSSQDWRYGIMVVPARVLCDDINSRENGLLFSDLWGIINTLFDDALLFAGYIFLGVGKYIEPS